jgi:hypothetical protein
MYQPVQEMFLPVHGYVELSLPEISIIDHPAFQRLRRVRQLGLAHFVFPGGTHSRFEHSIGAVYVAQRIVDSVNTNHRKGDSPEGKWRLAGIPAEVTPLIRLGALLHDIGHLPLGHTLEDELGHLNKHDGRERLDLIAAPKFPLYDVPRSVGINPKPLGGWSLGELVNSLYAPLIKQLHLEQSAIEVLGAIVLKAPKDGDPRAEEWGQFTKAIVTDQEAFVQDHRPLEQRLKQLSEEIPGLQAEIDFLKIQRLSSDQIFTEAKDLYSRWGDLEVEEKRHIIEEIIQKITITHNGVDIDLCYLPSLISPQDSSSQIVADWQRNSRGSSPRPASRSRDR